MQCRNITTKNKQIPARLAALLNKGFPGITVAGNLEILFDTRGKITGLFCSRTCPGSIVLPAFDHIIALRDHGGTVISGFHSEMEQECLKMLLRGSQPIIICPARAIQNMRVPDNEDRKTKLISYDINIAACRLVRIRRCTVDEADSRIMDNFKYLVAGL